MAAAILVADIREAIVQLNRVAPIEPAPPSEPGLVNGPHLGALFHKGTLDYARLEAYLDPMRQKQPQLSRPEKVTFYRSLGPSGVSGCAARLSPMVKRALVSAG